MSEKQIIQLIMHTKLNSKPSKIPTNPQRTYKEKGWQGWNDFLGKEK